MADSPAYATGIPILPFLMVFLSSLRLYMLLVVICLFVLIEKFYVFAFHGSIICRLSMFVFENIVMQFIAPIMSSIHNIMCQ